MVSAGTLFGKLLRKSVVSRKLLCTWFVKGRKMMSKRLYILKKRLTYQDGSTKHDKFLVRRKSM